MSDYPRIYVACLAQCCFTMTRRVRRALGFWIRRIARCVFAGKNDDLGKGVTPVASPGNFGKGSW
jgi:hypothetical protein